MGKVKAHGPVSEFLEFRSERLNHRSGFPRNSSGGRLIRDKGMSPGTSFPTARNHKFASLEAATPVSLGGSVLQDASGCVRINRNRVYVRRARLTLTRGSV